jgi:chromosome segregation ATPase
MNKFSKILLSIALIGACSNFAFAESSFTPLSFSDSTYSSSSNNTEVIASSTTTPAITKANEVISNTTGSKNMQGAITQLDNAQVEVRNELLKFKTKYADVDARYNNIKEERASLRKDIRACEKKIRQLDNAKEKIRKNMQ